MSAPMLRLLPELLPALLGSLVLLMIVRGAVRQPARPAAVRESRGANAELRALVARGATIDTISRSTRIPHDVASLAVHLEQRRHATRRGRWTMPRGNPRSA